MIALLACLSWGAAPAQGAPIDVIRDCSEDGTLENKYTQKDLSGALDTLPSDLDEYTDCRGVIRRAELAGVLGTRGKGILGRVDTQAPPSSREEERLHEASTSSGGGVEIGGATIEPGGAGGPLVGAALGTDLPPVVLVALLGLAATTLGGAGLAFERHRPGAWRSVGSAIGAPFRRLHTGVRRGISRLRR